MIKANFFERCYISYIDFAIMIVKGWHCSTAAKCNTGYHIRTLLLSHPLFFLLRSNNLHNTAVIRLFWRQRGAYPPFVLLSSFIQCQINRRLKATESIIISRQTAFRHPIMFPQTCAPELSRIKSKAKFPRNRRNRFNPILRHVFQQKVY